MNIRSPASRLIVGRMVDISESGIGAMLKSEVQVGAFVELEFLLPLGRVVVYAVVRQRTAFRYGFQFIEQGPGRELIQQTCRCLSLREPSPIQGS